LNRPLDRSVVDWRLAQYAAYQGRLGRYADLLAGLRGPPSAVDSDRAVWGWLNDALKALPFSG